MHKIILSGIKHSGKSTVGWDLASKLSLFFADLDDLLLRYDGEHKSVRDLYRQKGKSGFQKAEAESLDHFLQVNRDKSFVLSLGGGTIENENALKLLEDDKLTTIYLDGDESILFERIVRGGIPPFLEGDSPEKKFHDMYEHRSSLYKNWAKLIIETNKKTPSQITEDIIKQIS